MSPEPTKKVRASKQVLKDFMQALGALVEEAELEVCPGSISTTVIDPSHIGMLTAKAPVDQLDHEKICSRYGLTLGKADWFLKQSRALPKIGEREELELTFKEKEEGEPVLEMVYDFDGRVKKTSMLMVEGVVPRAKMPRIYPPVEVDLNLKTLADLIDRVPKRATEVVLWADPVDSKVYAFDWASEEMVAVGDIVSGDEVAWAAFPYDYLKSIVKRTNATTARANIGTGMPMKMAATTESGVELEWLLAPRIEPEQDELAAKARKKVSIDEYIALGKDEKSLRRKMSALKLTTAKARKTPWGEGDYIELYTTGLANTEDERDELELEIFPGDPIEYMPPGGSGWDKQNLVHVRIPTGKAVDAIARWKGKTTILAEDLIEFGQVSEKLGGGYVDELPDAGVTLKEKESVTVEATPPPERKLLKGWTVDWADIQRRVIEEDAETTITTFEGTQAQAEAYLDALQSEGLDVGWPGVLDLNQVEPDHWEIVSGGEPGFDFGEVHERRLPIEPEPEPEVEREPKPSPTVVKARVPEEMQEGGKAKRQALREGVIDHSQQLTQEVLSRVQQRPGFMGRVTWVDAGKAARRDQAVIPILNESWKFKKGTEPEPEEVKEIEAMSNEAREQFLRAADFEWYMPEHGGVIRDGSDIEHGDWLRQEGLLDPDEGEYLEALRKHFATQPDKDRKHVWWNGKIITEDEVAPERLPITQARVVAQPPTVPAPGEPSGAYTRAQADFQYFDQLLDTASGTVTGADLRQWENQLGFRLKSGPKRLKIAELLNRSPEFAEAISMKTE